MDKCVYNPVLYAQYPLDNDAVFSIFVIELFRNIDYGKTTYRYKGKNRESRNLAKQLLE